MRKSMLSAALAGLFTFAALPSPLTAGDFPLKDGDIWVMAGDSITAQHLHSNYFEAFCFARYPKLKFAFRNSGVGGHTIPTTLARFDYDIAAWKPTIVSVELGMNDQGGFTTEKYIANMATMVERIRALKARPVMFTASPINNGNTMQNIGGNKRLHDYAVALKEFSVKQELPFADQFHALVDIWGKNKPREIVANALPGLRQIATDDSLAGVEQLRGFFAAQDKSAAKPVSMQGDAVHPGPPGQLMMAAALLKALEANGFVSSLTIDAATAATNATDAAKAKGCMVTNLKSAGGVLSFERLDECLPFPIPNDARAVLPLAPDVLALSQYTLTVTNVPAGNYLLKIDGTLCARLTREEFLAGVNLTSLPDMSRAANPITEQSQAILAAVAGKEGLVGQWRNLSQRAHAPGASDDLKEQLAALTKKVEEADAKIRAAATPKKLKFEIAPAS